MSDVLLTEQEVVDASDHIPCELERGMAIAKAAARKALEAVADDLANHLDDDMRSDDWHQGVEAATNLVCVILAELGEE